MGQPSATVEVLEDAEFWGIDLTEEDLAPDASKGIWVESWPALKAFLSICTQWRMVADFNEGPRAVGLDYTAAEVGLRLAGIEMTPELWADVKLIEFGARSAMNGNAK